MSEIALKPYKTIDAFCEAETIINKSRFIGRAYPVETEERALELLGEIRKKHYDATHNCYAYVIRNGAARYSDDGEPGGTAGMPIMNVLSGKGLENILCVVTRYFGGVLLGAGGLVRAYSKSAATAVSGGGTVSVIPGAMIDIETPYDRFGAIEAFVRDNSNVINIDFAECIRISAAVPHERAGGFMKEIEERTNSRALTRVSGTEYIRVPCAE